MEQKIRIKNEKLKRSKGTKTASKHFTTLYKNTRQIESKVDSTEQ